MREKQDEQVNLLGKMLTPEAIPRVLAGTQNEAIEKFTETITTEVTEQEVKINKHKDKNTFTCGIHKMTAANY